MAKLSEICTINMGQSPESTTYNENGEGLPFFQGNADFGKIHPNVRVWCNAPKKIAHKNDILISVRAPIGALNVADSDCCIGRGLASLSVNNSVSVAEYIWYALESKVDYLISMGTGSTFKAIGKNILFDLDIPLPPLETQHQIAANLDKVTHTIDLCNAILEKLDLLVKSRFVEMFGEPLTNPKNWEVKRLDEVAYLNKGITYAPEDVSDEGIVVLRSSNIKGNVFDLEDIVKITKSVNSEKYVHKNDILMCNRNGSARLVGKVAKIPELSENMTFGTFMTIVRSDIYEYLFTFFQLDAFREQIKFQTAVAINQISLPLLASVKVPIPPKKLIDQFAAFVEQTDKSKSAVKQLLEKAEKLKKALMQEYFG